MLGQSSDLRRVLQSQWEIVRGISYGFILEARLKFFEHPTLRVSEVSRCACLQEEFLE